MLLGLVSLMSGADLRQYFSQFRVSGPMVNPCAARPVPSSWTSNKIPFVPSDITHGNTEAQPRYSVVKMKTHGGPQRRSHSRCVLCHWQAVLCWLRIAKPWIVINSSTVFVHTVRSLSVHCSLTQKLCRDKFKRPQLHVSAYLKLSSGLYLK